MQYSRGKGARTALITTVGFRDVLEMRRLRIPEMYTLNYQKPDPLVPRRRRLEVVERLGPEGEVRVPLDEESVRAAAERIADGDIEAVAISLLHAYANPAHERRVAEIVRETVEPEVFISCSSDILPVIREYERTSTTVINAYLGPGAPTLLERPPPAPRSARHRRAAADHEVGRRHHVGRDGRRAPCISG